MFVYSGELESVSAGGFSLAVVASVSTVAIFTAVPFLLTATLRRDARLQASDEERHGRVDVELFTEGDLEAADRLRQASPMALVKRIVDVVAALLLVIFLAPLLAITAIAIKLDSRGPVLYRQRRIGIDGKPFEIFKFRSMCMDAEIDGAKWAEQNDARVTRVGRLIRKTRIDEIPQGFNILRGEMSFVGPRPERPEFVEMLEREIPHYHDRHTVKPGITGWAQIRHEYTASVEGARDKLRYDLYYIKHFSPLFDVFIMVMTIRVALFGVGSR